MIIVTIRTDNPEAEVGLYDDMIELAYEKWHAHRELSDTLLKKIEAIMSDQGKTRQDIGGIVVFQGPGSFTGLRIGITVANTLAYGLGIPIVAAQGESWRQAGIARLLRGENDQGIVPVYGAPVHITQQKR